MLDGRNTHAIPAIPSTYEPGLPVLVSCFAVSIRVCVQHLHKELEMVFVSLQTCVNKKRLFFVCRGTASATGKCYIPNNFLHTVFSTRAVAVNITCIP
jgi:hypothetical protein